MSKWLYLSVGIPTLIQGYLLGGLLMMFRIADHPHFDGPVLCLWFRPKVASKWNYTTTIAACLVKAPWYNEMTRHHELYSHFRDYIVYNALGAVQAAVLAPFIDWWAFAWWGSSGALWTLPGFVTSVIENKRKGVSWKAAIYMRTTHEQKAYAITKTAFDGEKDPWERDDSDIWS